MKSNYISGKSFIKNAEDFDTMKRLLYVWEDERLSLEDFKNIWVGICYAFPEYDVYSFLKEDTSSLMKLDSSYTEEELKEEKDSVLEFFDSLDTLVDYDIVGLTEDILYRYLKNGDFTFFEGTAIEGYEDWDFSFPFPSEEDDKETLESKREYLKSFIDWAVSPNGGFFFNPSYLS